MKSGNPANPDFAALVDVAMVNLLCRGGKTGAARPPGPEGGGL
jgi:hypothetical protein